MHRARKSITNYCRFLDLSLSREWNGEVSHSWSALGSQAIISKSELPHWIFAQYRYFVKKMPFCCCFCQFTPISEKKSPFLTPMKEFYKKLRKKSFKKLTNIVKISQKGVYSEEKFFLMFLTPFKSNILEFSLKTTISHR